MVNNRPSTLDRPRSFRNDREVPINGVRVRGGRPGTVLLVAGTCLRSPTFDATDPGYAAASTKVVYGS